ncbi:MAG: 7,8-didemethyl-8-hydroxy-5-deazariboflavin synthase subunit 1 / 7,8-didemethyl-8-hydroxy-5-deazariboflavin synthase subunit 2, partial [uncultured Rubrobacteraceae bacterium]
VGQDGLRGGEAVPGGRLQRPRRYADEREHLQGGRGEPRPGDAARRSRADDSGDRAYPPSSHHALRYAGAGILRLGL